MFLWPLALGASSAAAGSTTGLAADRVGALEAVLVPLLEDLPSVFLTMARTNVCASLCSSSYPRTTSTDGKFRPAFW